MDGGLREVGWCYVWVHVGLRQKSDKNGSLLSVLNLKDGAGGLCNGGGGCIGRRWAVGGTNLCCRKSKWALG